MAEKYFITLTETQELYGVEKTTFVRPRYAPNDICGWCGKDLIVGIIPAFAIVSVKVCLRLTSQQAMQMRIGLACFIEMILHVSNAGKNIG